MATAEIDKTTIETPSGEATVAQVETPRGREGVLAKWRKGNPDFEGDPTEEQLWEYAGGDYDSLKGNHKKLTEGITGLNEYIAKDPRLGAAIGMSFGEGDDKIPFNHALGRLYGADGLSDDEDFIKGTQEYNEAQAQSRKEQEEAQANFQESIKRFDQYVADNELPEERKTELFDGIMQLAESFLMGNIPTEIFELINKGMSYDSDVQEAADTGFVEGKSENVRTQMKKKKADTDIPDMAGGTGAGKVKQKSSASRGSFYDGLQEGNE